MFRHLSSFLSKVNVIAQCNSGSLGFYSPFVRQLHSTSILDKSDDRRTLIASSAVRDEGTEGEKALNIDALASRTDLFPTEGTPNQLFRGMPFKEIPICNIKVSKNNTIITITDPASGTVKMIRSCGREGFKNARKGTNIAAQATAISLASGAIKKGYMTVRVRVQGLGPGRMSAIKGLQMGGLDIVSLTDNTPVSWNPPRPRKQRTL